MPRKKIVIDGYHLKFIPAGSLSILQSLANDFPFIKDKKIALMKYIELIDFIIKLYKNNPVGISQRFFKKKLKLENGSAVSKILKDLMTAGFLKIDKTKFKIKEQAYEYIPIYEELEAIHIPKNSTNKPTNDVLEEDLNIPENLIPYLNVLKKISFDLIGYKTVTTVNYFEDVFQFIQSNQFIYSNIFNSNSNTNYDYPMYCNSLVPQEKDIMYDNSFVPYRCNSFVPLIVPTEFIPVYKIISGKFKLSYPKPYTRIYTTLTNLKRCYRPFLRLNEKPLIGFDVANCQPLIATAAFKIYSKNFYGFIKDDIQDYQTNCEAGIFYDYFMQLNGIDANDEEARSKFKSDFFGKVFYPKIYPSDGKWLIQFKEKYPTCYEGMIDVKGGVMSENYKSFPATMTEIESAIFIPVNLEMIALGYDVLNIHDSLYSDSQEAIELAKNKIKEKFAEIGLTPLLKDINYQIPAPQATITPAVDIHIKKELQRSPAKDSENVVKTKEVINPYLTPRKITETTDEMLGIKSFNQLRTEKGFFESEEDVRKRYWKSRKKAVGS